MHIPSYQIHNVLKVYTKQLSQSKLINREKSSAKTQSSDKINLSPEGKRQAIIEKVAADIVDRITRFGPQDDVDHEIVNQLEVEIGKNIDFKGPEQTEFVFNVIDENNNKTTNKISLEDSSFLIKRLEELAKEALNKNMELT